MSAKDGNPKSDSRYFNEFVFLCFFFNYYINYITFEEPDQAP